MTQLKFNMAFVLLVSDTDMVFTEDARRVKKSGANGVGWPAVSLVTCGLQ